MDDFQRVIDGLPIGLPVFDIRTVGRGWRIDRHIWTLAGRYASVRDRRERFQWPACYGRGGTPLPTVTDANLILGRIIPDSFLGGKMPLDVGLLASCTVAPLAEAMGKSVIEAALGIVRVAEGNMASAVRAVTAQRGHDPRRFSLVSFGGAGGLHACEIADALDIARVLVPPYCGVLSALGMVVAPPTIDAARTIVHLGGQMNDAEIEAEFARLATESTGQLPHDQTRRIEYFADVRLRGQSHEVKVPVAGMTQADISRRFYSAYKTLYGRPPSGRAIEIVTLRVRRIGRSADVKLPALKAEVPPHAVVRETELIDHQGSSVRAAVVTRGQLAWAGKQTGPMLLVDAEATTFVPRGWMAEALASGAVMLNRMKAP